ncbi:MAG TPA: hypothetical protein VN541_11640, partial [Tepidisphaeraceae bacterium]|nr:hypothetical protein [Tepidisphaeraceae bacterium]
LLVAATGPLGRAMQALKGLFGLAEAAEGAIEGAEVADEAANATREGQAATDAAEGGQAAENSVVGQQPVKPGPHYNLDAGKPHPAALGRNGKVYVGTMHGQAFNAAADANGGTTGVIGSGEVVVDGDGNIVSSTIKPIPGR